MFGKLVTAALAALIGIALAGPSFDVTIHDDGFDYYSVYDSDDIADHNMERTAFVRVWIDATGLTVRLSDDPFEGAIEHTFTEIPELEEDTQREIWGRRKAGESFIVQRRMQTDESERIHSRVGMDDYGQGWAITHANAKLSDVVATYLGWLTEEGVAVEALGSGGHAASYQLSTEGVSMRVVFAQKGTDVRVYFQ